MNHVGLIGHPVSHSLSPRMQNAAFAARGLDWDYTAHDVEDALAGVASLLELGFVGANVTIPHKQAVVAACDEADGDAVNTLVFRDGRVLGFNTDKEILAGIVAEHACVIGAGGAARTLAPAIAAPDLSVTVPDMVARKSCPHTTMDKVRPKIRVPKERIILLKKTSPEPGVISPGVLAGII